MSLSRVTMCFLTVTATFSPFHFPAAFTSSPARVTLRRGWKMIQCNTSSEWFHDYLVYNITTNSLVLKNFDSVWFCNKMFPKNNISSILSPRAAFTAQKEGDGADRRPCWLIVVQNFGVNALLKKEKKKYIYHATILRDLPHD